MQKKERDMLMGAEQSSFEKKLKSSKNRIFGSQFLNNLTEIDNNTESLMRQ